MNRPRLVLCAILCLSLLTACGGGEEARFESFREGLAGAVSVAVSAEVTADKGDAVESFTLSALSDGEGCDVTVLSPELIAGVTARVSGEGAELSYDGVRLPAGGLSARGLSPLTALPLLLSALESGHVERIWREGGGLAVTLIPTDAVRVHVTLGEGGAPVLAELEDAATGRVELTCVITQFNIQKE